MSLKPDLICECYIVICNFKFLGSSPDQIVSVDMKILSKSCVDFVRMQEKGKIWVEAMTCQTS